MDAAQGAFVAFIAMVILAVVAVRLVAQRKRASELDLDDKSWLRSPEPEPDPLTRHAPLADFHVHGSEARVTFDVPLPDENDPILNDLLLDEAVEVVREKRHNLPISDVTDIVVLAGKGNVREIGRTSLPSPGQLPPPAPMEILSFSHVARDPFSSPFEDDAAAAAPVETKVSVPRDELGPLRDELRIPAGLERGMRARGVDPDSMSGPDFILTLLELFDYKVVQAGEPNTYMAAKGNTQTFIRTEIHGPGTHPEIDEAVVRKFLVEFGTSGAQRGMLITDKYGPYMIHDIEIREPRIRCITRERAQRFIDSMALG